MEYFIKIWESVTPFFSSIAWPLVAVSFLWIVREPLKELIRRIEEIAVGKFVAKAAPSTKQREANEKSPVHTLRDKKVGERLEKALSSLSLETQQDLENVIKLSINYESLQSPEEKEGMLLTYAKLAFLVMTFNSIYYTIYGSQIKILQKLNSSESESKESLISYYNNSKSANPSFYANYSFEDYMNYLQTTKLIQRGPGNIFRITTLGIDFLKYLVDSAFTFEKPY